MACTRPLVRTKKGAITSLEKYIKGNGFKWEETQLPTEAKTLEGSRQQKILRTLKDNKAQLLPCGHCAACKLTNSKSWANRLEMETHYHVNAWFITLTYDDKHVPYGTSKKGDVINLTLNYKDIQDFIKRLRRHIDYHNKSIGKLMYYYAGEYGGKTHRPHFHGIFFDVPIKEDELKKYKSQNGNALYTVEWVEKLWGKGFITVAPATWETMAYTARYTTKKIYGKEAKKHYENLGIEPEKCEMSLKPAIGAAYYFDHKDEIYANDTIYLASGKTAKPPRYFDKLFDLEHANADPLTAEDEAKINNSEDELAKAESEELKIIKRARRKAANDALFAQMKQEKCTLLEHFEKKEKVNEERMKKLIRNEI